MSLHVIVDSCKKSLDLLFVYTALYEYSMCSAVFSHSVVSNSL